MDAHVLLNLLDESRQRDKMGGLSSIVLLFRNEFNEIRLNKRRYVKLAGSW